MYFFNEILRFRRNNMLPNKIFSNYLRSELNQCGSMLLIILVSEWNKEDSFYNDVFFSLIFFLKYTRTIVTIKIKMLRPFRIDHDSGRKFYFIGILFVKFILKPKLKLLQPKNSKTSTLTFFYVGNNQ